VTDSKDPISFSLSVRQSVPKNMDVSKSSPKESITVETHVSVLKARKKTQPPIKRLQIYDPEQ
jgi:hypothetical protein